MSPFVTVSQAATGNDQEITVGGRPNRYNNMQIDGAVNNDVFGLSSTGTPGGQTGTQPVSLDAIQEIQVVVSPYDVRQGGFSGGGINAITKSGSNSLHGTAYYFGRNQKFVGTIPQVGTFANPNPGDSKVGAFSDKQSGFSLGGPIVKNKVFFFGNARLGAEADARRVLARRLVGAAVVGDQRLGPAGGARHRAEHVQLQSGRSGRVQPPERQRQDLRADGHQSVSRNQLTARVNYVKGAASIGSQSASTYNMPDHFYYMTDKMLSSVVQLNTTPRARTCSTSCASPTSASATCAADSLASRRFRKSTSTPSSGARPTS